MESVRGSDGKIEDDADPACDQISAESAVAVQDVMRVIRDCCLALRAAGRLDLADALAALFSQR